MSEEVVYILWEGDEYPAPIGGFTNKEDAEKEVAAAAQKTDGELYCHVSSQPLIREWHEELRLFGKS